MPAKKKAKQADDRSVSIQVTDAKGLQDKKYRWRTFRVDVSASGSGSDVHRAVQASKGVGPGKYVLVHDGVPSCPGIRRPLSPHTPGATQSFASFHPAGQILAADQRAAKCTSVGASSLLLIQTCDMHTASAL